MVHNSTDEPGFKDEIFGPVLSVLKVNTAGAAPARGGRQSVTHHTDPMRTHAHTQVANFEEALKIENASDYGNAACVYTTVGAHAEWFTKRFRAGMIGVNIGVPVPR